MLKRVLSLVLVLTMVSFIFAPLSKLSAEEGVLTEESENKKVTDELLEKMDVSFDDLLSGNFEESGENYSCIIWIDDINMTEAIETGIDTAETTRDTYSVTSTYSYPYSVTEIDGETYIEVNLADDESDEYVQTYIESKRRTAVELYEENNSAFVQQLLRNRSNSITVNFVSSYSPCIFADLSTTAIASLALQDNVCSIGYWGEIIASDSDSEGSVTAFSDDELANLDTHLSIINAYNAKNNYSVTGDGIKIGQYEIGCPSVSSVTKPSGSNTTPHAKNVYDIMSKVAQDATYYAHAETTVVTSGIEWLLDQGVNIINMSYEYTYDKDDCYNEAAKWIDHIMYNHDVHVVIASGNRSENATTQGITGFAMGYNVITVGNTHMTGNYSLNSESLYNYTRANNIAVTTAAIKPDLCAPGTYASTGRNGTSYATPLVTGTIALLCEYQPSLKTKQHVVKAILAATTGVASADRAQKYTTGSSGFYKYGAGIIDARAALWVISQGRYTTSTETISASTQKKSYSMSVSSSDTLMRVALSYSNEAKLITSTHTIADATDGTIAELKLEILTPDGKTISCSTLGANLKVLEFKPSEYGGAGIYTISVIQTNPASDGRATLFGIAWR